jgi:hypothetical protein
VQAVVIRQPALANCPVTTGELIAELNVGNPTFTTLVAKRGRTGGTVTITLWN